MTLLLPMVSSESFDWYPSAKDNDTGRREDENDEEDEVTEDASCC